MMWEEKIEKLKKEFSAQEFHIPFTNWLGIMKGIESKFIVKQSSTYFLTNWKENIKSRYFVHGIASSTFQNIFIALDESQTYWFVAVMGNVPTSKQYVYSCSPRALLSLASMTSNDFFIVDKRLSWFTYFHRTDDKVIVYKSGETETPFDTAVLS
ncbi:hypothetical protein GCM10027275_51290 [Rhabdobacter roseus]|uniref:Uncharacterized protein n=1 Tax=Rhabdobacter roseus TaxID=1655419 RepID=A0A840U0V3_9BACT|nr:hypothetical protein [Rhabdobacter roseus]MBB5287203.1 hypothetical protein [Rhabdobacter roseus]